MTTAYRGSEAIATNASALQIREVADEIIRLSARQTTLTTLTMKGNRVSKKQRTFEIPIQTQPPDQVLITAITDGTHFTVGAADLPWLAVDMQVRKSLDAVQIITAMDYGTGIATVADSSGFAVGDYLARGNAASREGSAAPTPITRIPANFTNYCETARWGYGLTRWAKTTMYYGGAREVQNRMDAMTMVKLDIERGLWLNKAQAGGSTTTAFKTAGLLDIANTAGNVIDMAGNNKTVSLQALRKAVTVACRFMPSDEPLLFVPRKGAELIDLMKIEKVQPHDPAVFEKIGLAPTTLYLGTRRLKMYEIDCLNTPDLANTWAIVDPKALRVATTTDAKTGKQQWMLEETNARLPGYDGDLGVVTCDFGGDFVPNWCWLIKNCNDYAV